MNVILYVMVVVVLTTLKMMDNFASNRSFLFLFQHSCLHQLCSRYCDGRKMKL